MRRADWEVRLGTLVAAASWTRFEWGRFDCCTFAADAVVAVRGDDPLGELRGSYGSLRAAWRLLSELGGLRAAVTAILGAPMTFKMLAQRGDIALVNADRYPALAVVIGQSALAPLKVGLQRIPVRDWVTAWQVA